MTSTSRLRCLEPEWLDELPTADPRAIRSRRDLARLNRIMRHARMISADLLRFGFQEGGRRIIDLGGGDGCFLLSVARLLPSGAAKRKAVEAVMLDRLDLITAETRDQFRARNWRTTAMIGDVFDILPSLPKQPGTAIIANLFLHHFDDKGVRSLLRAAAELADVFIACEPRRSALALLASRLVGVVGCNEVTRHDAISSVRAGFRDSELTALWHDLNPHPPRWSIEERTAGWFSHRFVARRAQ
jgi:hypothetical protein